MTDNPSSKISKAKTFAAVMAVVTSLILAVATLLQAVTSLIQLMQRHP